MFLSCIHRPGSNGAFSHGLPDNEDMEEMAYRIRSGEVVDEATYPKVPHMSSEDVRRRTFQRLWPSSSPVRPRSLAQAGLFYMGESDRVACFCCAGMLAGWEPGDTAWGEHSKHFANCFFILGHDVGNLPSQGGAEEEEDEDEEEQRGSRQQASPWVPMGSFQERLDSYTGIQHPIDSERLARAGFYSTGSGDRVMCFCCGGGAKSWQHDEDPWVEHAKLYPGCSFLLTEKGPEFINQVQLQERNVAVIQDKLTSTGSGYSSVEVLVHDCLNTTPASDATPKEEEPIAKLQRLQMEKQCKICMDRDICMVFIPCGHLVCCGECSQSLSKCPICCGSIAQKVKIYNA
ncbi:hypothetical protein CRUP_000169 [Coryphaenoides rupestris]|nr:hypothetical protein CRUP_000169 [Coryphaenoides rupestris]